MIEQNQSFTECLAKPDKYRSWPSEYN